MTTLVYVKYEWCHVLFKNNTVDSRSKNFIWKKRQQRRTQLIDHIRNLFNNYNLAGEPSLHKELLERQHQADFRGGLNICCNHGDNSGEKKTSKMINSWILLGWHFLFSPLGLGDSTVSQMFNGQSKFAASSGDNVDCVHQNEEKTWILWDMSQQNYQRGNITSSKSSPGDKVETSRCIYQNEEKTWILWDMS